MNTFNYRNVNDLNNLILRKLSLFSRDFDLIVGLPESGLIPANLLALYLNRPFTDLHSFLNGHIYKAGERGSFFANVQYKRVLVIDDVMRHGVTMAKARERLSDMNDRFEFSYCVVYMLDGNQEKVDLFLETIEEPAFMQWHLIRDGIREKTVFNKQSSPVYCDDPNYPFLLAPNSIQATATFRKTGKAVLSLSDFDLVDSVDSMWSDLRSGRFLPGIKQAVVQLRNTFKRFRKKMN
ncbi:MAG: phosphoribosyltransferase [Paludibacter sp.]|jgi:hypoxanthine phosphoribosyltransferase|nr:phosphoribosyltransferase [Paludibacter sp.]